MALTENKKIFRNGDNQQRVSAPARAATYYTGEFVGSYSDDTNVKIASGSAVAGGVIAGIVTQEQTIATDADYLEFEVGDFVVSGSGFTAADTFKLVYASNSDGVFDAHAAGRLIAGRVVEANPTGVSPNNVVVRFGLVPSGSTI